MAREYGIEYGNEYMKANEKGLISRKCLDWHYSKQWKIIGAVRYSNFGYIVESWTWEQIKENPSKIQWKYKNGKQRVHIKDFDHGAIRVWMSPTHYVFNR